MGIINMKASKYNSFNHIECPVLQAYNRANTLFNMKSDGKEEEELQQYINRFPENERMSVYIMLKDIYNRGLEAVRAQVNRDFVLNQDLPENVTSIFEGK